VLVWSDADFPRLLRQIPSPPALLYVRGELAPADDLAVAMVGTRSPTSYGREAALRLAGELAANGVTVVSGLARGIDAAAHRGALEAGGRTLAVLGNGVDVVYPPEHNRLAEEMCARGALLSEYPLGRQPAGDQFPARNRLISGLALGVVVVEAREKSGALITADFALQQGRDVFAVPGSIFAQTSTGPHRLIQDGAKLVMCAEDILSELNVHAVGRQPDLFTAAPLTEEEHAVLDVLSGDPLHIDEIAAQARLPIHQVSSLLTLMEVKGLVHATGGMTWGK